MCIYIYLIYIDYNHMSISTIVNIDLLDEYRYLNMLEDFWIRLKV